MGKINKPNFEIELSYVERFPQIIGVDEVGRGAIAGPIVAGAVAFENHKKVSNKLKEIRDSKILSAQKRLELDELIKTITPHYSIGIVDSWEIDQIGIGAANILAFKKAIDGLKLEKKSFVLIDGRNFHGFDREYLCLEKGESKSISIAAASIIAKVYRDALMQDIHQEIFRYDFASNKGYGSKTHYEAINTHGPSRYHRKTFMKWYFEKNGQNTLF